MKLGSAVDFLCTKENFQDNNNDTNKNNNDDDCFTPENLIYDDGEHENDLKHVMTPDEERMISLGLLSSRKDVLDREANLREEYRQSTISLRKNRLELAMSKKNLKQTSLQLAESKKRVELLERIIETEKKNLKLLEQQEDNDDDQQSHIMSPDELVHSAFDDEAGGDGLVGRWSEDEEDEKMVPTAPVPSSLFSSLPSWIKAPFLLPTTTTTTEAYSPTPFLISSSSSESSSCSTISQASGSRDEDLRIDESCDDDDKKKMKPSSTTTVVVPTKKSHRPAQQRIGKNKKKGGKDIGGGDIICTIRWLEAIQNATNCLVHQSRRYISTTMTRRGRNTPSLQEIDHNIDYLLTLETALEKVKWYNWDNNPMSCPPKYEMYQPRIDYGTEDGTGSAKKKKAKALQYQSEMSLVDGRKMGKARLWNPDTCQFQHDQGTLATVRNSFGILAEDDDDFDLSDDDEDEYDEDLQVNAVLDSAKQAMDEFGLTCPVDDDEAGDMPVLNHAGLGKLLRDTDGESMSMRRIMIRIVTAKSELLACQARAYRREKSWDLGAECFRQSLELIHRALTLANAEVTRVCCHPKKKGQPQHGRQGLQDDANIVEVALGYFSIEREAFRHHALEKQRRLKRKLEANEKLREMIRRKMGERWYKKKKGGGDISEAAKNRLMMKDQVEDVTLALDRFALNRLASLDARSAAQRLVQLKLRLKEE